MSKVYLFYVYILYVESPRLLRILLYILTFSENPSSVTACMSFFTLFSRNYQAAGKVEWRITNMQSSASIDRLQADLEF